MNKAVFFDRDGVINQMVFDTENGLVHTPCLVDQVNLNYSITDLLKETKKSGFLNVIISNQPDIGLKKITKKIFNDIEKYIFRKIENENAFIDKAYYCFHHPYAKLEQYKKSCDCRKPKIGLLLQASKEMDIDLSQSWMIGDGLFDIIAGHDAGCRTILIANEIETGYLKVIEEKLKNIKPDHIVKNVKEAIAIFTKNS